MGISHLINDVLYTVGVKTPPPNSDTEKGLDFHCDLEQGKYPLYLRKDLKATIKKTQEFLDSYTEE